MCTNFRARGRVRLMCQEGGVRILTPGGKVRVTLKLQGVAEKQVFLFFSR